MTHRAKDLTAGELEELCLLLNTLKEELESLLSSIQKSARPVELTQPIGRVTRIDALAGQSMAKASRRNIEVRLRQVNTALAAAREGEYGRCRQCGESIGYPRLKARPETAFCLQCQSESEQGR